MAFRLRAIHRGKGKPFSSGSKTLLWTQVQSVAGIVGISAIPGNIVTPSDWERQEAGFERATVLRVVGWLSTVGIDNATAFSYGAYIMATEVGTTSPSPLNIGTYDEENITWSYIRTRSISANTPSTIPIDIRVKRKLTTGMQLRFVESSGDESGYNTSYFLRALLSIN